MRRLFLFCLFTIGILCVFPAWTSGQQLPFRNPKLPIEERLTDLIARLTLEEKARQLNHTNRGIPRLGIPMWGGWNQTLHGVWSQQPTTLFPAPIAMGATWDPDLIQRVADSMSDEARALYNAHADGPRTPHGLVFRSPVVNVARDPRWGRIQEVFSEDPFLTSRMGIAYVRGLQGDDPNHLKLAATVKHFAVYNVETGRQHLSAAVDEANLMNYWLWHWRAIIQQSHPQSLMSSYNAINGMPSAVNRFLLTDILRKEWGFDGFVTDDLGAVALLTAPATGTRVEPGQRWTGDPVEAAAAAIKAGNDSDDVEFEKNLPLAVQRHLLTEDELNQALRRVLRVGFRLGAFDPPEMSPYSKLNMSDVRAPAHLHLAEEVAERSMTLLSNRHNFLPLEQSRVHTLAVIGPAGGEAYETGNYYGKPARKTSVVQGLQSLLGSDTHVAYEQGTTFTGPLDPALLQAATKLAKESEVVVLCLGTNLEVEAEGRDRRNLALPGAQQGLLEAIYEANPKTVLVLMNAGPLALTWAYEHVPAILGAWFGGEEAGTAVARTLFGFNNPGGHLPYTMYASLDGVPPPNEYDVSKGYTYEYFKGVPLFPFGHGLSYTSFEFNKLQVEKTKAPGGEEAVLSFNIVNTGKYAGDEVAQVYIHQQQGAEPLPIQTLHAFRRVSLKPGETKAVELHIPIADLERWNVQQHGFKLQPGLYDLRIGVSSDDIRLRGLLQLP